MWECSSLKERQLRRVWRSLERLWEESREVFGEGGGGVRWNLSRQGKLNRRLIYIRNAGEVAIPGLGDRRDKRKPNGVEERGTDGAGQDGSPAGTPSRFTLSPTLLLLIFPHVPWACRETQGAPGNRSPPPSPNTQTHTPVQQQNSVCQAGKPFQRGREGREPLPTPRGTALLFHLLG